MIFYCTKSVIYEDCELLRFYCVCNSNEWLRVTSYQAYNTQKSIYDIYHMKTYIYCTKTHIPDDQGEHS